MSFMPCLLALAALVLGCVSEDAPQQMQSTVTTKPLGPTHLPLQRSPSPPPPPGTWAVDSGACTQDGPCISSPNFPNNYANDQSCLISVGEGMGPISVEAFRTESGYDKLTINGEKYHGQRSPDGVTPTSDIEWYSDYSVTQSGWKICSGSAAPSPSPSPNPIPAPTCGAKGPDSSPWSGLIVNGQTASRCEWRWQAQLRLGTSGNGSPFCGGSLISDRWVLTAAHCTDDGRDAGTFTVKLGDYDRLDDDSTSINRNVVRVVSHPDYDSETLRFDFSLLELDSPVPLGDCIGTVCLPEAGEELPAGAECWITGWGRLSAGSSTKPQFLQEAMVTTRSNSECNSAYGGIVTSDMLCANGANSDGETTDACSGDSGGPLVCDAGSGRFVLHGATSWGSGCADPRYPGVWARVSHELDWIHSYVDVPTPSPSPAPTPSSTQLPTPAPVPSPPSTSPAPAPSPPTPAPGPSPPGTCGAKGPDSTPWGGMIVNGQPASQCEWRWQAQLRGGTSGDGSPFCGGALISDRWVMTAAHCTDGQAAGTFTVKLGDFDRLDDDAFSVDRNVARIIQHPDYNSNTMSFDFSLLELDNPVPLGDCIGTVCLPEIGEELPAGAECWITGWGTVNFGDSNLPQFLQEAMVTTKSNSECNSAYGGRITDDMLCANGVDSNGETTDACQGDSGGPLVCDAGSGRFVLHGATSWGYGCANPQYPGVWARISHELDWIHSYVDVPAPGPSPAPTQTPSSTEPPTSTPVQTSTELALTTSTSTTTSALQGGDTCQCECVCQCQMDSSSVELATSGAAESAGSSSLRGGGDSAGSSVTGETTAFAGVGLLAVAVLGASSGIGFAVGRRSRTAVMQPSSSASEQHGRIIRGMRASATE